MTQNRAASTNGWSVCALTLGSVSMIAILLTATIATAIMSSLSLSWFIPFP
jgi:hypothetical protein